MPHLRSIENCQLTASLGTIGSFDGVHLGHQAIIQQLVNEAHKAEKPSVVVTFFPHPAVVLHKVDGFSYLASPEERAEQLKRWGVDYVITMEFTEQTAEMTAQSFMQMLCDHLRLEQLWVGQGFTLGHNGQGTVPVLRHIGDQLGYTLHVLPPFTMGGEKVSSRYIRQLLRQGKVRQAAQFLGRNYSIRGKVIHGDKRGHTLGFPTANLDVWSERIFPSNGIYATWAKINSQRLPSVTNIGVRPTFTTGAGEPRIETYIMDFSQDIYGNEMELDFVEYLRPEQHFDTVQLLVQQIYKDTQEAREVLSHDSSASGLSAGSPKTQS